MYMEIQQQNNIETRKCMCFAPKKLIEKRSAISKENLRINKSVISYIQSTPRRSITALANESERKLIRRRLFPNTSPKDVKGFHDPIISIQHSDAYPTKWEELLRYCCNFNAEEDLGCHLLEAD